MEGQNAAREVNLEDVRGRLVSCVEHANGIISRCTELREHVDGCAPPKDRQETRNPMPPTAGIVTDLSAISQELAERLQQIENLVVRTANRLGVPPATSPTSLAGPRLARG